MSLTHCNKWLMDAGYKHHCFISYPRIKNPEMGYYAQQFRDAIEQELGYLIHQPKVFMDSEIQPGTLWEGELTNALCKSLTMVALCSPIYYDESHTWCGREWAAMELLRKKRIQNKTLCNIIPLIVRESTEWPKPVADNQGINLTPFLMRGKRYFNSTDFGLLLKKIVSKIEAVAIEVTTNQIVPACDQFKIPAKSAFANWRPATLPASANPFWGKKA